jgi:oxygen-independent coproporphyrinogen III oxidase
MTATQNMPLIEHSQIHQSTEAVSLYVHIPFCKTRCTYCAFNTYTGLEALIEPFTQAMCREIELVAKNIDPLTSAHTLYFGGGTPSLLEPEQVRRIIDVARSSFALTQDAEITLELNPGTADLLKMRGFLAAGVNRLSIGVQSAQPGDLELFARNHTFQHAADAFHLARSGGFDNISVDLIYGAPNQTRDQWRDTVDAVLSWEPDHISLYSLTLEPQTLLERQVSTGLVAALDPDLAADMYDDAKLRMRETGMVQYEISNWSLPGLASRHNSQYWLNRPFFGFGPGAHGAAAGVRYWNIKPVHEYLRVISEGDAREYPFSPALADHEVIDRDISMAETIILGLRLVHAGLDLEAFEQRFEQSVFDVYPAQIEKLTKMDLIEVRDTRLHLKEHAYLVSNRVFVEFMPD